MKQARNEEVVKVSKRSFDSSFSPPFVFQNKKSKQELNFYDRRLCLKNVPKDMTKPQVLKLVEDFEDVNVYMP